MKAWRCERLYRGDEELKRYLLERAVGVFPQFNCGARAGGELCFDSKPCEAILVRIIPEADHAAQQAALAAVEEVLALECDAKNLAHSVGNEDEIHEKKVAALAQIRAIGGQRD